MSRTALSGFYGHEKGVVYMRSEAREELANYLLNHCFVIGNLDSTREKYYLITNNEEELQTIFRPLGYSIVINRTLRVAQLVNLHECPSERHAGAGAL